MSRKDWRAEVDSELIDCAQRNLEIQSNQLSYRYSILLLQVSLPFYWKGVYGITFGLRQLGLKWI